MLSWNDFASRYRQAGDELTDNSINTNANPYPEKNKRSNDKERKIDNANDNITDTKAN